MGSGEAGVGWGVGGGDGEGAGGCGHALAAIKILSKHLGNASQVWVVARKRGPGGVRAVGVVRARGGVGTHWQPLNTLQTPRKCEPGLCSGEETRARGGVGGVGGGGGEGAGGRGHALAAFEYV